MLVTAGVLIPAEQCSDVAAALADWVRRHRADTAELRRLAGELSRVAATSGHQVDAAGPVWVTTAVGAGKLGRSERTVRRWATTGRVPAKKVGNRWLVQVTDGSIWQPESRTPSGRP